MLQKRLKHFKNDVIRLKSRHFGYFLTSNKRFNLFLEQSRLPDFGQFRYRITKNPNIYRIIIVNWIICPSLYFAMFYLLPFEQIGKYVLVPQTTVVGTSALRTVAWTNVIGKNQTLTILRLTLKCYFEGRSLVKNAIIFMTQIV